MRLAMIDVTVAVTVFGGMGGTFVALAYHLNQFNLAVTQLMVAGMIN